ncbi:hypothetical protein LIER_07568 [Lithospermum erythrorhizon]|uniref:PB1-like domain-containing protein n=1 Tax=Lithospermum erythrorhizon TaxID=34254 RepID=A0AAV3PAM3_LITER
MVNHRDKWSLRPEGENDEVMADIYDQYDEYFTIRVHFLGTFEVSPLRVYKGGMIRCINFVELGFFNMSDMDYTVVSCGYKLSTYVLYLYRISRVDLDNGLRPLQWTMLQEPNL